MPCSDARLEANRLNAQHSTGPTSEEGKSRSRGNALKHGLTGNAVVVPGEDAAEIDRRAEAIVLEISPKQALSHLLAHRVAALTVRLERSVRHESATLAERVRHAATTFDDARADVADHLIAWIASEPATFRRKLERTPEGCDRLIWAYRGLRVDLMQGGVDGDTSAIYSNWSSTHAQKFDEYLGRRFTDLPASRCYALTQAFFGDSSRLFAHEGVGLDQAPLRTWARDRLAELIDEQIADLEAHRATLDLDAIAADRREAGDRALFDPSPAAVLARKYEAATERTLFRTLREIRAIDNPPASAPTLPKAHPPQTIPPDQLAIHASQHAESPLGSFFPETAEPGSLMGSDPNDHPNRADLRFSQAEFAKIGVGTSILLPARV